MTPQQTVYTIWIGWLVSWTVARLWSNRTEKRDTIGAELLFRVFLYAGLILLFVSPSGRFAQTERWRFDDAVGWLLAAITAAGLLFTWWARIHLGPLWSDLVVRKTGHRVIDTGPYRLVRHPIYSGLILAVLATAALQASSTALVGTVMVTLAFFVKARREERFLRIELGREAYDEYARKTPMLVPLT
jgi:protein-S-isoprenylcysteine O-methyltransferase Ste14